MPEANCCPANGLKNCWIPVPAFLSSPNWPVGISTMTTSPAAASSRAWDRFMVGTACWWSMTPPSRAAPTTRLPSKNISGHRRSPKKIACPVFTSSIPVGPICRDRTRCSLTGNILAASFSIRPICRPTGYRRSRWSWGPAQPVVPTCRPCPTRPLSSGAREQFFWAGRL